MQPDLNALLFERAKRSIPGGVNSPVRAFKAVGGTPRFVQRAQGAYFWDANGKQHIDAPGHGVSTYPVEVRKVFQHAIEVLVGFFR